MRLRGYAHAMVPTTSSNMTARTEDCVIMLPTGNRTGSVKMLSLATGNIVVRDQFKILPMPASAIARMNALATADGRGDTRSLVIADDRPLEAPQEGDNTQDEETATLPATSDIKGDSTRHVDEGDGTSASIGDGQTANDTYDVSTRHDENGTFTSDTKIK